MYPPQTPTTTTTSPALQMPTAALPELCYGSTPKKEEKVMGLFPNPLQGFPNFSTPYSAPPPMNLAHQISEPELVGIKATSVSLNSIASMI